MINLRTDRRPMTVHELVESTNDQLARLGDIQVEGEVSRISNSKGHYYFAIKDDRAMINAVLFQGSARKLSLLPEEGSSFIFRGRLEVYAGSGKLSLIVTFLEYASLGKLKAQLEALRRLLETEGAFTPGRKKPIPYLPRAVAVITSPTGAAIRDFTETVQNRFPNMDILVYPAQVQGKTSAQSVINALEQANNEALADVVVITRGGGSFEDLFAFQTEPVVRAIMRSHLPVITAIGHSTDECLSDLVSDWACRTPTEAGNKVVPDKISEVQRIGQLVLRLDRHSIESRSSRARLLEQSARRVMLLSPERLLAREKERVDNLVRRVNQAFEHAVGSRDQALQSLNFESRLQRSLTVRLQNLALELGRHGKRLDQFDPLKMIIERSERLVEYGRRIDAMDPAVIVGRGYAIAIDEATGKVIRNAKESKKGSRVKIKLAKGELKTEVKEVVL